MRVISTFPPNNANECDILDAHLKLHEMRIPLYATYLPSQTQITPRLTVWLMRAWIRPGSSSGRIMLTLPKDPSVWLLPPIHSEVTFTIPVSMCRHRPPLSTQPSA